MDFLKGQLARLQQQFGQLTASQKMLSVALVAIMGMTLVWWGRYAGTAEMEPLLDQELASEDFSRITANLRAHNIPYTPIGSRIMVPADRRFEAVAELGIEQMLPKDFSSAFMDIVTKMDNPMNSGDRSEAIRNEAKQATLAAIMRHFPNVQNAMVVIDATQKRSFNNPVSARSTVYLKMKSGEKADNKLVNAAADVVSGAVAGLQRSDVKVIVDGVSRLFATEDGMDGMAGGSYLDRLRESEAYYAGVVIKQLAFCDGVMVHVNVVAKDESSQTETEQYDLKTGVFKELENDTETSTSSTSANRASGDVGVGPNTGVNQGMTIGGGGAGGGGEGQNTTMERTKVKMENHPGRIHKTIRSPAGALSVASASVTFPRSFFVKAYQSLKGDKEPNDAVLQPFISDQLEKLRKVIKACLNVPTDESVVVDSYVDFLPAAVETPTQTAGVSLLLGSHGKEIALGVLALASLFMVSLMVRKTGPAIATAGGAAAHPGMSTTGTTVDAMLAKTAGFQVTSEDAAEVGEGGRTLDGIELDDEAIRAQQVVEQVSTMVKENPDAAANLIKRWMIRT